MNIGKFVTLIVNSGLIRRREVETVATVFQEGCREFGKEATAESFGEFLIETDRLTRWQCDKLQMGKWKGFFLDQYLLLDQVGKGTDFSSYKARDTESGKLVCLVVTPLNQTGGRIEYRVEPC